MIGSNKVNHNHNIPLFTVTNWCSEDQEPDYCVVSGAHAFVLRVSSYFGLAPLRFVPHPNGFKISLSKPKCIYSYILITILVTMTILGITAEINVGVKYAIYMTSRTTQVVFTFEIFFIVLTAGAGVYGAPKRMKNLFRFMNSLASVDRNVGGPNSLKNERKFYAFLLAMLPVALIFLVFDYSNLIYSSKKFDRLYTTRSTYTIIFVGILSRWIGGLTHDLINYIQNYIRPSTSKLDDTQVHAIKRFDKPPLKKGDGMINYSGCYLVWHMIFLLEMQFAFTALSVRARIAAINDALAVEPRQVSNTVTSTHQVGFCITLTLWCAFKVLRSIVIVDSCHKTVQGRKKTELLVCQLMNDVHPEELLSEKLQLFSKQLILQGVSYSPLGLFTLDRPILTSAISAIITYLVIIIQFQTYDK